MDLEKLTEQEVEKLFEHAYQKVSETKKNFLKMFFCTFMPIINMLRTNPI